MNLLIVDLFCGAGGTTIGFCNARPGTAKVIACVNHDPKAIESHWANHPDVLHFEEDIRTLELTELVKQCRKMQSQYPEATLVLWASLECTNFSKAKGGKPRDADSRTLADHLHRYVEAIKPGYVQIENVVEFMSWGPLDANGKPVSRKNGTDWLRWRREMCAHGFTDEWRELNAADFGAFTSRNRLFGIFATNGLPITWPRPTHSKKPNAGNLFTALKKWNACRPCLDLQDHGSSIFTPRKIKSDKTFERIFAGLVKYVAGMGQKDFISKYYSGRPEGKNITIDGPAGTITTLGSNQALVQTEFLIKYMGNDAKTGINMGKSLNDPFPVIATSNRTGLIRVDSYLHMHYSNNKSLNSIDDAAPTIPGAEVMSKVGVEWLDRQFSNGTKHSSTVDPAGSVLPVPKMNLVQPQFILDTSFNNHGKSIDEPAGVITANRKWYYLMNPQYLSAGGDIEKPSFTLIARMDKAPPYLVQVESGELAIAVYETDSEVVKRIKHFMAMYGIVDIKMRMLKVVELKRIQGFPEEYVLKGNQSDQKKFIGNSVVPQVVTAWAEALAEKLLLMKSA